MDSNLGTTDHGLIQQLSSALIFITEETHYIPLEFSCLIWMGVGACKIDQRRQEKGSDHRVKELNGSGCTITTRPSFPTKMLRGVKSLCKMCDSFMRTRACILASTTSRLKLCRASSS